MAGGVEGEDGGLELRGEACWLGTSGVWWEVSMVGKDEYL